MPSYTLNDLSRMSERWGWSTVKSDNFTWPKNVHHIPNRRTKWLGHYKSKNIFTALAKEIGNSVLFNFWRYGKWIVIVCERYYFPPNLIIFYSYINVTIAHEARSAEFISMLGGNCLCSGRDFHRSYLLCFHLHDHVRRITLFTCRQLLQ